MLPSEQLRLSTNHAPNRNKGGRIDLEIVKAVNQFLNFNFLVEDINKIPHINPKKNPIPPLTCPPNLPHPTLDLPHGVCHIVGKNYTKIKKYLKVLNKS